MPEEGGDRRALHIESSKISLTASFLLSEAIQLFKTSPKGEESCAAHLSSTALSLHSVLSTG